MHTEQFQLHAEIEERHWWFVARRRILKRLVAELLPPGPHSLVVDVGCGTGANIAAMSADYRCVGIDTSTEAIALARRRFPQVQFLTGYAPGDLGELASQASLFMLTDVLEHVADDFALLSELLSSASPGACLLLTVPADPSLWSRHDESFGHYRRYDPARLECVWSGLPVQTLLVSYFNARLTPIVRLVRLANRWRGKASGAAGTDFWLPAAPANGLLQALFAGEGGRLVKLLHGHAKPYRNGSSLIAVLRRGPGDLGVRQKPPGLAADHQPAPELTLSSR